MSDHKEHITHYSAADIQRYVQGKLSAREMHAMEKAALDDPFLADAMEGMQQAFAEHDESLVTGQQQQLQQQFQARTAPATKVVALKPFRYWQAVAAAVVVIITGVWIYSLLNDFSSENNERVIAKTEEKKAPAQEPAPVVEERKELSRSTDSTPAKSVEANVKKAETPTHGYRDEQANAPVMAQEKAPVTAPAAPVQKEVTLSRSLPADTANMGVSHWGKMKETDKDAAVAKQETAAPPVASATNPEFKKARKESAYNNNVFRDRETELITIPKNNSPKKAVSNSDDLSGVIKGKVTDQNNNPIANAYVQITKNNNNFITDKTGFFKIPASDSVVDVAVNVTGYGTQNFRLENNATMNQLQLQPANAAIAANDETYKTDRYQAAIANKLPNYIVHDAEPIGGWVAFDQYLEKNKKPIFNNSSSVGQVIVSFEVNKKGELSGFKVEQSLSKAYDDEATRLIMQGPGWKLLKKVRKARVTVIVRF